MQQLVASPHAFDDQEDLISHPTAT